MKNLIETISRLWWIKVRGELTNPHSEKSMKALEEVLVEDLCFDDFVVDYVMEAIGDEPKDSEEEKEDSEETEDETPDEEEDGDKAVAIKNIKHGSLTQLEKDRLKEVSTIKFQEFCVEVGKIISDGTLLTEASVWDKSPGTEMLWTKNTPVNWVKGKHGVPLPKGPYIVVSPTDDAIDVDLGSSGEVFTAYIKASGKVYKMHGSSNKMKNVFVNSTSKKSPYKIKWGENEFESAACTGLYFDPKTHYKNLTAAGELPNQKVLDDAISAFKSALKAESAGKAALDSISGIPDVLLALELAMGVQNFATAHNCVGWNFIHKSIQKYYDAEKANGLLIKPDNPGKKDNTADTIIFSKNSSVTALLKSVEEDKVTFDSSGKCTTASGVEFYQISNKKSESGAQLGRIQKAFQEKYGLGAPLDTWRVRLTIEAIEHGDSAFLLNEGLMDYFKQGLKYIKDTFVDILDKIKSKVSSFSKTLLGKFRKTFKKPSPSLDNFMKGRFNQMVKQLNEASKPRYSYQEYSTMVGKDAADGKMKEINELKKKAVDEWDKLEKLLDVPDDGIDKTKTSTGPIVPGTLTAESGRALVLKLMVNYMAYEHVIAMLKSESGSIRGVSNVLDDFVELEKEMYFGRTELPLFKVYGITPSSGTAWHYLKSGKEFTEQRKLAMNMDIVKDGKYIPGIVVQSSRQGAGHATIAAWILHSVTEEGTEYTKLDFRSSDKYTLTFSVQGNDVVNGVGVLKML